MHGIEVKMRVVPCVFILALTQVTNTKADDDDDEEMAHLREKVDVYPGRNMEPVPFGHITIEGFGDPFSSAKQPVDFLELRMRAPKNDKEAKDILMNYPKSSIQIINPKLLRQNPSPKDIFLSHLEPPRPRTNVTKLKWYDLADLQVKNAMLPPTSQYVPKKKEKLKSSNIPPPEMKRQYFSKRRFGLVSEDARDGIMNWTTCDQFAVGAVFSPKEIVDYKWTPFYIWSPELYHFAIEHTFQFPTQKLVAEYKSKYGRYLNKTVDWQNPKLYMTGFNNMLLIAADKRGLFDAIPQHDIPDSAKDMNITLPSLSLRMKIEDPYLVLTHCEQYYATIMAITGKGPTKFKEMKEEAESIKFVGPGRPVWRDYEGEKERARLTKEKKLRDENDKFIISDELMPPVAQYD